MDKEDGTAMESSFEPPFSGVFTSKLKTDRLLRSIRRYIPYKRCTNDIPWMAGVHTDTNHVLYTFNNAHPNIHWKQKQTIFSLTQMCA